MRVPQVPLTPEDKGVNDHRIKLLHETVMREVLDIDKDTERKIVEYLGITDAGSCFHKDMMILVDRYDGSVARRVMTNRKKLLEKK